MSGIALVVVLIAQSPGDPMATAFAKAARGVLGSESRIEVAASEDDPADDESVSRAGDADGVVELSWSADRARIHCWVAREQRWVDREISFGAPEPHSERETRERGRLLGLAVATMFVERVEQKADTAAATGASSEPPVAPQPAPPAPSAAVAPPTVSPRAGTASSARLAPSAAARTLEFAGTVSSGIRGTAGGLGALAGLRFAWAEPLWARFFVAGRAGNIPTAQASTRSVQLGAGLALAASPGHASMEVGARLDAFAYYFEASHLSEDDAEPDRRSRWLPGGDVMLEAGYRLAPSAGLFGGGGLELVAGRTDIYTHGQRVAVVPPLRFLGEIGFRANF